MSSASPLTSNHRLATYGTLMPGQPNAHELAKLEGRWFTGIVRGYLSADGWGATLGYPGLKLDPDGDEIKVHVLESKDLPDHWARLDAFEGEEYARVEASVETADGVIAAYIYVVNF